MAGKDQFMNFFAMSLQTEAAATTFVEESFNTGAGVATLLAWRIHLVEWFTDGSWSGAADGSNFYITVSTRKGLSVVPALTDKGTIAKLRGVITVYGAGTGAHSNYWPKQDEYLPPQLIASPTIALQWDCSADFAGMQSKNWRIRLGFTTQKLTESAYREVFETWNFAN